MSMSVYIPDELKSKEKKEVFLSWLRILPAPLHTKKYLLLDWGEYVGLSLKRSDFVAVGIPVLV